MVGFFYDVGFSFVCHITVSAKDNALAHRFLSAEDGLSPQLFQLLGVSEHNEKRNASENPERTIDQLPVERNTADGPGNERQREHRQAGHNTETDDPDVLHGVDERADESGGDDQMGEGQPICSVGEKRVIGVAVHHRIAAGVYPLTEARGMVGEPVGQPVEFCFERESGGTRQHQTDHKKAQPNANAAKVCVCVHCLSERKAVWIVLRLGFLGKWVLVRKALQAHASWKNSDF